MYINEHYQPELRILSCDMVRNSPYHQTWTNPNLSAPVWRFYWMPKPHAELILGKKRIKPGAETIVLIPPNTPFKSVCNEPLYQFVVHFLAASPYDTVKPALRQIPVTPDWQAEIDAIIARLDAGNEADREFIMLNLSLCLRALTTVPPEEITIRPEDRKIAECIKRIENDLKKCWNIEELASTAGLSENTLIRRFRNHSGMTPQQFIIHKRLEYAGILLSHSELSIDEIAEEAGFCHRNHFTQAFRKRHKIGPAAYRKRMVQARQ